jgi:hypothetical protein
MQISTNPIQYMMSEMQSVMSAQPFSGLASSLGAGQDVPGSSASSTGTGAASVNPATTPSSQMSPDLLSSLIAAQASASSDASDLLSQLQGAGAHHHHHHHHGATQASQTSQTNSSASTSGQTTAEADESDGGAEGQQTAVASAPTPATS